MLCRQVTSQWKRLVPSSSLLFNKTPKAFHVGNNSSLVAFEKIVYQNRMAVPSSSNPVLKQQNFMPTLYKSTSSNGLTLDSLQIASINGRYQRILPKTGLVTDKVSGSRLTYLVAKYLPSQRTQSVYTRKLHWFSKNVTSETRRETDRNIISVLWRIGTLLSTSFKVIGKVLYTLFKPGNLQWFLARGKYIYWRRFLLLSGIATIGFIGYKLVSIFNQFMTRVSTSIHQIGYRLTALGFFSIFVYLFYRYHAIRVNTVYRKSFHLMRDHPQVKQAVGVPVRRIGVRTYRFVGPHFWKKGRGLSYEPRRLLLMFPVNGPKGTGLVQVNVSKKGGKYKYDLLALTLADTPEPIILQGSREMLERLKENT